MQVHVDSKSLILKLRDPKRVMDFIPKARVVPVDGVPFTQVKFGLDEARVLRNLGIKAPSPIRYFYDWPSKYPSPLEHQVISSEFFTLNNRGICLNDMGCVDATTEYLSPTGWVRIDQYAGGKVAQYHPDTGAVEFVEPTEYVKKPCPEMIRFKTRYGVDQLLSPEHRVLYLRENGEPAVDRADNVEAINSKNKYGWGGKFITSFACPADMPGIPLTDAELRVQVAVMADGYFRSNTNHVVIAIKRQRKIDRLRMVLDAAGIQAHWAVGAGNVTRVSFDAPLRVKEYDSRFWAATVAQLRVITDEAVHWDGHAHRNGSERFNSASKASADFIQYAYAATGRAASVKMYKLSNPNHADRWVVQARLVNKPIGLASVHNRNVWREPSPDGFKYCFMVPSTFLLLRRNGCIFATGNTGKTLSALWAADYLMRQRAVQKAVIVCTKSTMSSVWLDEVRQNFLSRRKAVVLSGTRERRLKLLDEDADFYIVNHDGLKVIADALAKRADINLWIYDEAGEIRNPQSQRHKVFAKLVKPTDWMWLLTGTPCPKDPTDVWGLAKLLGSKKIPQYFTAFRNQLMMQITQYKWIPKPGAFEMAYEALTPSIRFKKSDCLDLPPVTYTTLMAEMTKEQRDAYEAMRKELVAEVKGVQVTAAHAATKLLKLMQISLGCVIDEFGEGYSIDCADRLNTCSELVDETDNNVIIFVPFTKALDMVAKHLRDKGNHVEIVDGRTSDTERKRIFGEFQNAPGKRILVAHPKTAAHGLTLTRADLTIWYGPITDLGVFEQANNRMDRPGQKNHMTIACIASNPLELELYSALKTKQQMQNTILAMFKNELGLPNN